MKKEEQFFEDRSRLISRLIDYIKICQEVERDIAGELEEVLCKASAECEVKLDISIMVED